MYLSWKPKRATWNFFLTKYAESRFSLPGTNANFAEFIRLRNLSDRLRRDKQLWWNKKMSSHDSDPYRERKQTSPNLLGYVIFMID